MEQQLLWNLVKTRNSSWSLSVGDVDYLIATDAIGVGLNMDINEIYFSNLKNLTEKKQEN